MSIFQLWFPAKRKNRFDKIREIFFSSRPFRLRKIQKFHEKIMRKFRKKRKLSKFNKKDLISRMQEFQRGIYRAQLMNTKYKYRFKNDLEIINFVFASFIFTEKCKISRKSLQYETENFRIFSLNVSFAGNHNFSADFNLVYFCIQITTISYNQFSAGQTRISCLFLS